MSKANRKNRKLSIFTRIWSLVYLAAAAAMVYLMIHADILPTKYLYGGIGAIAVISLLILPALFLPDSKNREK
jgi:hypothetical protein